MPTRFALAALVILAAACGDDDGSTDAPMDAGARPDAARPDGGGGDDDGGTPVGDAGTTSDDAGAADDGGPTEVDGGPPPTGAFLEEDGLIVFEIESAPRVDDWAEETAVAAFAGTSYYRWDIDTARTRNGGSGVLSYDFTVTRTGRYQLHLRSAAPDRTEENDAFVRFVGLEPVTVRNDADATCPDGAARERPPEADGSGWFKLYQNQSGDEWTFTSHHHDNCAHRIFVDVASAGTYTVEFSGRSTNFKLDRVHLRHVDVDQSTALDPSLPESSRAP